MSTAALRHLTCRQWKLSPISCLKGPAECPYAHFETGVISPPARITCWAWKHGGCKLHEDGCLFLHADTDVVQLTPSNTRPFPMTGKNLAIAKAAANTGFDCTDVERVMLLVNAVRDADMKAGYPDYYVGQSRKPSEFLPARHRQRRQYRDLDNPAVPAFTLDASQIVRNIQEWGTATFTYGYQNSRSFGSNKRAGANHQAGGANKKQKTSSTTGTNVKNRVTVDLTRDDPSDYVHPSRRNMLPRPNNSSIVTKPAHSAQRPNSQRGPATIEEETRRITTKALENISRAMAQSLTKVSDSRDTLKRRWDADRNLQLQSVTDQLADLNECFTRSEEALRDSIAVIEERLLKS